MYSPLFIFFSCCHCFCRSHCCCHFIVILLSFYCPLSITTQHSANTNAAQYFYQRVFLPASIPASVCFLARLCWLLPDNAEFAVFCGCILWLDSLPLHHCFSIAAYCHTCLISTPHSRSSAVHPARLSVQALLKQATLPVFLPCFLPNWVSTKLNQTYNNLNNNLPLEML